MEQKDQEASIWSALDAFLLQINIFMKVCKTISLKVNAYDTVKTIKKIILESESLSESEDDLQDLHFQDEKLQDGRQLIDYSIQENHTLDLVVKKAEQIKLIIHFPSQQKILEVDASIRYDIKKIKSLIDEKEGLSSNSYALYFKGMQMEDHKRLSSFEIGFESQVYMVFHPKDTFLVSVTMPGGEVIKVEVKPMHTIRDLKVILGSMLGYHIGQQNLVYIDKKLEDWRTLAHYNIGLNSKLRIWDYKFQIFVKDWNGKILVVSVQSDDKVSKVKSFVFKKLRIPADVYKFEHAGKFLDVDRDLESYGIQRDCTLDIVYLSCTHK